MQKCVYIKVCSGSMPASLELKISFPNQESQDAKGKVDEALPEESEIPNHNLRKKLERKLLQLMNGNPTQLDEFQTRIKEIKQQKYKGYSSTNLLEKNISDVKMWPDQVQAMRHIKG
jgi:hypothetical protein